MSVLLESEMKEILDIGSEDKCGLFEVVWALRTSNPSSSERELVTKSIAAMKLLLTDGFVSVFMGTGLEPDSREMEPKAAMAAIEDESNWQPSDGSNLQIWFTNTEAGNRRYYGAS